MENKKIGIFKLLAKIFGILSLVAGGILLYFGFYDFFASIAINEQPTLFVCSLLGIPIFSIGVFLTVAGFTSSVSLYIKKQILITDETKSKVLVKIKTSDDVVATVDTRHCSICGTFNDIDSKFCKSCGNKL